MTDAESTTTTAEPTSKEEPQDERTRVLRMVADGRITVDEAVELLKALQPETAAADPSHHEHPPHGEHQPGPWQFGPFFRPRGARGRGFAGKWVQHAHQGPPGFPQEDVLFHVTAPVPPIPPVPPSPPRHPTPPAPPAAPTPPMHAVSLGTTRVLVFDAREEDKRYNARLPLGLVTEIDRFLPRQVRQALEENEIDAGQLIELVNSMDPGHGGQLIDIQAEDKRLTVRVEIPGHPELG